MRSVAPNSLRSLVEAKRDEIKAVAARHKGTAIGVFGSVARGEEGPTSDIDFLVRFDSGSSLFDLADLARAHVGARRERRRRLAWWTEAARSRHSRRRHVAVIDVFDRR